MAVTKEAGIAPYIDFNREMDCLAWKHFHNQLNKRDKNALGKVIGALQSLIDSAKNPGSDYKIFEKFRIDESVSAFKIINHLEDYFGSMEHAGNEERDRLQWNYANNILRCLKNMHQGTEFLLPYEDRKITSEFIDRLQIPPINRPYKKYY